MPKNERCIAVEKQKHGWEFAPRALVGTPWPEIKMLFDSKRFSERREDRYALPNQLTTAPAKAADSQHVILNTIFCPKIAWPVRRWSSWSHRHRNLFSKYILTPLIFGAENAQSLSFWNCVRTSHCKRFFRQPITLSRSEVGSIYRTHYKSRRD